MLLRSSGPIQGLRELNRGLSADWIGKYFEPHGSRWRIKPAIRRRVRFSRINLIEAWPTMPKLDIVLLRNVLIYFEPETKRRVLAEIKPRLADDGVLVLGGAETTLGIDSDWQRVSHGKSSSYRLCREIRS